MPDSKNKVLVKRSLFRCQSIGIDVSGRFSLPLAENQGVDSSNLSLGTGGDGRSEGIARAPYVALAGGMQVLPQARIATFVDWAFAPQ
jgi:hypothetical protein